MGIKAPSAAGSPVPEKLTIWVVFYDYAPGIYLGAYSSEAKASEECAKRDRLAGRECHWYRDEEVE